MTDQWDAIKYPSLTDTENDLIRTARRKGFTTFYPVGFDADAETQDTRTLDAAKQFLEQTVETADGLWDINLERAGLKMPPLEMKEK